MARTAGKGYPFGLVFLRSSQALTVSAVVATTIAVAREEKL